MMDPLNNLFRGDGMSEFMDHGGTSLTPSRFVDMDTRLAIAQAEKDNRIIDRLKARKGAGQ